MTRLQKQNSLFISLLVCCFMLWGLSSCSHNEMYYQYQSFQKASWHKDSIARFEVLVSDTLSTFDIDVKIRNNNSYQFENLWLFVDFTLPSGESRRDTLECILADHFGKWEGKGFSLYDLEKSYKSNVRYPQSGVYTYSIQHGMRQDVLKGISDVGIRILKCE